MSTAPATLKGARYQALYRSCMKDAAAQGRSLMRQLVVRARKSLPQSAALAASAQERKLLSEAARILMKHEGALCEAFPQVLLAEFAHAIGGDSRRAGALSFDSIELLGDDQVHESMELLRTQQAVQWAVEGELAELNGLMSAVQGLETVQLERNPLRPQVYVRSLRTVTLQSPVPAAVRARWMQHLGEAMGLELAFVYRELSAMLRREGVSEAGFSVPAGAATPAAGLVVPSAGEAVQARAQLNVTQLRRLLSGEFDPAPPGAPTAAPADFSETVPAALETLQEMRQVDQVIQRMQQRQAAGLVDAAAGIAALRAELQTRARGTGQALGLEVVELMVDNIANDPRLLQPVQQTVRDLEPALLRLALTDPRFFSDKKHPARQLLDQLTQRSLAWQAADMPGFTAFLEPVKQAVDALLVTRTAGSEPFEFALASLAEAWGDQQNADRRTRERAVQTLLQAEQRNLLADKIAAELRSRSDVAGAPREIARFLMGPWSQVMAHARLADQGGEADPGGYGEFVTDLTSSVQPRLGPGNAARLARLVPPLLEILRNGLSGIGYPPLQTRHFLSYLESLHHQALQPPSEPGRPALPTALTGEEPAVQFGDRDGDSYGDFDENEGSWLAPLEVKHSGFMVTQEWAMPQALFPATQPGSNPTPPPGDTGVAAPSPPQISLEPGAWVELFTDGSWGRFQLTWASPHGTLFMFGNAAGKTHSTTRRLLDKMMLGGTLRLVSGRAVVEGALDAVAHVALRNSLDPRKT